VTRTALGTEVEHQEALVEWARTMWWWKDFAHWPNERIDKMEAYKLYKAGVKPGLPDNWLFLPVGTHMGAVSELKRPGAPPSATSKEQNRWLSVIEDCGFLVTVSYGVDEAMAFFEGYAGPRPTE
jgi:hypothetical protein